MVIPPPHWKAYHAALKSRGSLSVWIYKGMQWHVSSAGKRGRQAELSDAAIQLCLTIKCLFNLGLRQTTGFVDSLL